MFKKGSALMGARTFFHVGVKILKGKKIHIDTGTGEE